MVDAELARAFKIETKRLNEQVKRNGPKFGERFTFQPTEEEWESLKSEMDESDGSTGDRPKHGGRRYRPWLFTEYGVVMAATVVKSPVATEATKQIVEVFVEVVREGRVSRNKPNVMGEIRAKATAMLMQLLDTVVDPQRGTTVAQEAQGMLTEFIRSTREQLRKTGLENAELEARVAKILAEIEHERERTGKTRAERQEVELRNLRARFELFKEFLTLIEMSDEKDGPVLANVLATLTATERKSLPEPA